MFPSKSCTSSKIAEWLRILMSFGSPGAKVPLSGSVRRGPLAKIQTTLSVKPNGWQAKQELQPSLESREPAVPNVPSCGRLTPVELLKTALPSSMVASARTRRRQIGRAHGRGHLIRRQVDDGHIARHLVHHISPVVARVDGDAARVLAHRNAHHFAGIGGIERRVNGGSAVGIQVHLHHQVARRSHHVALVGIVLERDGPRHGQEHTPAPARN